MNQKQIYTEYWKILDDYEDYMNDRFRRERLNIPDFKVNLKKTASLTPGQCCACSLHENSTKRSPVTGEGIKKLLIINRALPLSSVEKGEHFSPEEFGFISKWLEAIGIDIQKECKVISLVFCPVGNPLKVSKESINSCSPFIDRLIDETQAEAILILGREGFDSFRDKMDHQSLYKEIPLFVTHHPFDVLIDLSLKRPVWEVLKNMKEVFVGD